MAPGEGAEALAQAAHPLRHPSLNARFAHSLRPGSKPLGAAAWHNVVGPTWSFMN